MHHHTIRKSFVSDDDMQKINTFSRRTLTADEVYTFTATLCDNDIDRDFEKFSLSSLYTMASMFIGKTGIADHSMKSADQKARIFDAYVEKQEGKKTADGEQLYALKAKAYMLKNADNMPLIEEIEAGIKKEISVSCSMEESICSVCGRDRRKEHCGHIAGRRYSGKLCYATLSSPADAYEFSFVAVPAQRGAGVTKAFKITEETTMTDIISTLKSATGDMTLSGAQTEQLCHYIDELKESATLGEEYKKELAKEVVRLFSKACPAVEKALLTSVVSVMTAKELFGFKQGLEKSKTPPAPQLLPKAETTNHPSFTEFKI